jgi:Cu/Zn superoxide dismutase
VLAACLAVLASVAVTQSAQSGLTTKLMNADGKPIGTVTLTQTPHGVLVEIDASGLKPGEHGLHFHETGRCDPETGFKSAGGHFAPAGRQHGYLDEKGYHAGDMPNQFVAQDGRLRAHVFNPNVTLSGGKAALRDADGSALVIHSGADDYRSQPSGDSGDRIACAVIR